MTKAVILRLEASIDKAAESGASQHVLDLALAAAASSKAEVACAEQLRESTASHSQQGTPEALQLLEDTIREAQTFYRLEVRHLPTWPLAELYAAHKSHENISVVFFIVDRH